MGILRTDRVSGLGGANVIKGSVFFSGDGTSGTTKGTSLNIVDANDKADLNFAGNDFTFEAWIFPAAGVQWNALYSQSWGLQIYIDTTSGDNLVKVYVGSDDAGSYAISGASSASGTIKPDSWNHVAFSRSGNSWTIFTNGTAATSSTSSQSLVPSNADYAIGIFNSIYSGNNAGSYFGFNGYISNLRIRTGAHYLPSTNFTPPVGELQKTSDTVLLACQSPGDVTKEATGKTLVPTSKSLDHALPKASHLTPHSPVTFNPNSTDLGTQSGSTYSGEFKFDSQSYMVLPGGITRDRYPKSTGDIVSGNLIFHLDGGDSKSYAGVTTSGDIIYDLKEGTNSTGVGIATMTSGHSDFGRVTWVPDNRGCFRQSSDSDFGSITGNRIEFPQISLGNDNYTINVWVKLNSRADGGDEIMHIVSNKDGGPVSFNAHLRVNSNYARIGAQAYYSSWTYRYATTTEIKPGFWYMLTWVNTAQYTGSMYVDGVLQKLDDGNTTWNSRTSNNTPLNATAYAGGETFDGWIGQIQFYSDTLSETEILQNYNAHKCRYIY